MKSISTLKNVSIYFIFGDELSLSLNRVSLGASVTNMYFLNRFFFSFYLPSPNISLWSWAVGKVRELISFNYNSFGLFIFVCYIFGMFGNFIISRYQKADYMLGFTIALVYGDITIRLCGCEETFMQHIYNTVLVTSNKIVFYATLLIKH